MERLRDATRRLDGLQQLIVRPRGRDGAKFRMDRTKVKHVQLPRLAFCRGDVKAGRQAIGFASFGS